MRAGFSTFFHSFCRFALVFPQQIGLLYLQKCLEYKRLQGYSWNVHNQGYSEEEKKKQTDFAEVIKNMPNTLEGVVLLGYMEKSEAITYLQEHCWFEPQITEQAASELWERYHKAVTELPGRQIAKPARLPIPKDSQNHVRQFLARHRGPEVLDVINVDPRGLAIYQFYVAVDRSDQHANTMNTWTRTCLQIDRPAAQLPIRSENNVVKISLPHAEHGLALIPSGGFQIQQGGGFISVCEINGRMILKAGYHRSFAFVRAKNAPEAKETSLLVALTATAPPQLSPQFPTQGLRTMVLGSRPPLFSDFFEDSLAMRVKLRKKKYEVHIKFEQIDDL